MARRWLLVVACGLWASGALAGVIYVPGAIPDWNQPYKYNAPGGPGPDPVPGGFSPWDAWCAPTSAANLVGHWQDQYGAPVSDGFVFPASPAWGAASWHDYDADANRPAPNNPAPPITDIGYYMDTNRLGMPLGNGAHIGTFVKDIHAGLLTHLQSLQPGVWTTGTQGKAFAGGLASNGLPAVIQPNANAAFNEIVGEINAGRTLIVSWLHWNIAPAGPAPVNGADFYDFQTSGSDPWSNDEIWNGDDSGNGLGHAVTAVGYLLANDPLNPWPGTSWVVVRDNVPLTPLNVAVPMNWNVWVANTNAVPEPSTAGLLALGLVIMLRRVR
jgi:hypothetical protein